MKPLPHGAATPLVQMAQRLPLSDVHFRRISQLIYQRAGIVLAEHKREMVYNRLVRRLRLLGINDFGSYLAQLESDVNSAEWQAFINALTTNLTAFFREAHHFPILPNMPVHGRTATASGAPPPQPAKSRIPSPSPSVKRWGSGAAVFRSGPAISIRRCWRRRRRASIGRRICAR
ncbi:Chemotaxis protein methyltransferase [Serratia rubidaea]|uniref:Chemotaxis protein methyltransferase n=1 Tax=Serratia rubidaea TaxID=61652 RepID=A0A4U9HK02_SERRU|nr:Chemotaxis protein methyltransferase [Serratia rubidaea]